MKSVVKKIMFFVAVFGLSIPFTSAEMVKSLDFSAVTNREKVVISIDNSKQTMEYSTPSRDYKYVILDYDLMEDPNSKSSVFTGTVVDTLFNTASEVVIYSNDKYADMRLGRKQITFTYVEEFKVKN